VNDTDLCKKCGDSPSEGMTCEPCLSETDSKNAQRIGAILGAADGLTIVVALLCGRTPELFHAALSAGIGEFVGMGAALWLTNKKQIFAALLCGLATLLACIIPALPFAFCAGLPALLISGCLALSIGAIVCWLRPEKGLMAIGETYGVLAAAGIMCYGVSFLFH
jgi:VIT1/CCC1 family predicted Fe2+/Mn2+ transporter